MVHIHSSRFCARFWVVYRTHTDEARRRTYRTVLTHVHSPHSCMLNQMKTTMDRRQLAYMCMHLLYVSIKFLCIIHTVIRYIFSKPIRWLHWARQPAIEPKRKTVNDSNLEIVRAVVLGFLTFRRQQLWRCDVVVAVKSKRHVHGEG